MPTPTGGPSGRRHQVDHCQTLVEVLRHRAQHDPDGLAYVVLTDGEGGEQRVTYGELDRWARGVAAALRGQERGSRVVLLLSSQASFLAGFLGVLYAGCIAVPVAPPAALRFEHGMKKLEGIFSNAGAAAVLASPEVFAAAAAAGTAAATGVRWIELGGALWRDEVAFEDPRLREGELAFLQYTSGSTSAPKGVMVSHRNLMANTRLGCEVFAITDESRVVSWLPFYHDMGLIGCTLLPLVAGVPSALMLPMQFLESPVRWLRAITRYRGTVSPAPNFAYDYCVKRVSEEERRELDLSSWTHALNGAEPVRAETLTAFANAFAQAGFSRNAFSPCYGLAEATLIVSGAPAGRSARVKRVNREQLALDRIVIDDCLDTVALVSAGAPAGWTLRVVNPATLAVCGEEEIGELWISGPSATGGYWNLPEETASCFEATLAGEPQKFIRTGDLGFLSGGELFITGRLKDLIIISGKNHYPQDIEHSVEGAHPSVRTGGVAAFSTTTGGEERLVVVAEIERRSLRPDQKKGAAPAFQRQPDPEPQAVPTLSVPFDPPQVVKAIRAAVTANHSLIAEVVLIKPLTLPKTTSGKVQRRLTRARYLEGTLSRIDQPRKEPSS